MSTATGVVLLNYGAPDDTLACLASLERSDDLDVQVLVVDNGPADERHEQLREAVGRRAEVVAAGDNLGYAAGNNVGIAWLLERGCDFLWILNPDTVVEPTTLTHLREALEATPDCGIVGPRILHAGRPRRIWFDGGVIDEDDATTRHLNMGAPLSGLGTETVDVDFVTGASMLVRRALVEDVGPIPTRYFLYHEEVDWCRRARRAGWRLQTHRRARMTHHKRSSGLLPEPYYLYYMTRNRFLFAQDCLGIDGEHALDVLDRDFLVPWRAKVERAAPAWLDTFDSLVAEAKADARAGRDGRRDDVALVPRAVRSA